MAYNIDEEIRVIRQGQGMPATQIVPPGMSGHDPTLDARRAVQRRRRARRCSTISATRIATATATASCPTAVR